MRARATLAILLILAAALAGARAARAESIFTVPGFHAAGTPTRYDRVQVRRFGSPKARKVLVLVPGTLGGAGDFTLVARYLAQHVPGLQVWAEMRREGALEDNSMLLRALKGKATFQQLFGYYLGWLADPSIQPHYQPLKASDFGFVKGWGLNVAMQDLHRVVMRARDGGRRTVILGGHSLGGAEVADYAVWSFGGRPGYKDIAGMIGIDGGPTQRFGSSATTTAAQARTQLAQLDTKGPFLDLLGFGLPWVTGPFAEVAAFATHTAPHAADTEQNFRLLPPALKPPIPVTNAGQLGYAFDSRTSPPGLALIQVHSGHLSSGNPADWVNAGPTPIQNVAAAFAQEPLGAVDWYYPMRLSIDVVAASSLRETAAARVLGLNLRYLHAVNVPYYVIETSLGSHGGDFLIQGARAFKRASRIPRLTVVNRSASYSHLDPLLAAPPQNAFLKTVVPWLRRIR